MQNSVLICFFCCISFFASCRSDALLIEVSQPTSISFWIKWSEDKNYWQPFYLGRKASDNETIVFGVNNPKAKGKFTVKYHEKGKCKALKTKKINDNKWHHIVWYQVGGYKGLHYGLYVDGEEVETCLVPKNKRRHVAFEAEEKLKDKVKGIRIFDYALSPEDVANIHDEERKKLKMLTTTTDNILIESTIY